MAKGIKTGGRVKGTENKLTNEMRNVLKSILYDEIDKLPELLKRIDNPEKKINILIKLMPFVFPKVASVNPSEGEPMIKGNNFPAWFNDSIE